MNNATRFLNSWSISSGDSELKRLILDEFTPFVSFMVESPKYPGIRVTAFRDNSAIIDNNKSFTTTSTKTEFINAFLRIFNGNKKLVKQFFVECVSIIVASRGDAGQEK